MLQFYFLSVLLNVLAGLVLVYATDLSKKNAAAEGEEKPAAKKTTKKTTKKAEAEKPAASENTEA